MKRSLLAGCAVVAFTGLCGTAAADGTAPGKFDVKLGGDAYFTAGYTGQSTAPISTDRKRAGDFTNRFRLQVTATANADNGLEYGASMRIRAWGANGVVDADQAYIFADGGWGRLEGGVTPGPNTQYGITAPSGFGTGGVLGDWSEGPSSAANTMTWLNNQNTYLGGTFGGEYNTITGNNWATKINYFTPRFFAQEDANTGLMAAISFTPHNLNVNTGVSRSQGVAAAGGTDSFCGSAALAQPTVLQGCGWSNIVESDLFYSGTFNGVSVSTSFGYEQGKAAVFTTPASANSYNDLRAYQFGVQFGYAGVLIGGGYQNAGKSGYTRGAVSTSGNPIQNKTAQSSYNAGISYENGPAVVGFNYEHGEDAGDMTLVGSRKADLFSVGATYTLAPGLTTSLEYLYSVTHNQKNFSSTSVDYLGYGSNYSSNASLILWKNVITF